MLTTKIAEKVYRFSQSKHGLIYKLLSLVIGTIFFLVILPWAFIWVGKQVDAFWTINWDDDFSLAVELISIPLGLFFLSWATFTQWQIGGGTPAPNAPTQRLITSGPYKLCRNPIQFGALSYYLGIGTWTHSFTVGIVCLILALIFGTAYHHLVEEKELRLRFGEDYEVYRKTVPFLWPKFQTKINQSELKPK